MSFIPNRTVPEFLMGGGEMGELTRHLDWSNSSLGDPENWPQSLKTTLGILLNSRFPMFLFWGEELTCFYNDAYRPSLGINGKHPGGLGKPGAEFWPEIWHIIKPLIDTVLETGTATWSEDQLIPIYRNGMLQDVYWTFSYSPVKDESGKAIGVFVTCTETTKTVQVMKGLARSADQLTRLANAMPQVVWIADSSGKVTYFNERVVKFWGAKKLESGIWAWEAMMHHDDLERTAEAWTRAVEEGSEFEMEHRIHMSDGSYRWHLSRASPQRNEAGEIEKWFGTATDIHEQKLSEQRIKESEAFNRIILESSPDCIAILSTDGRVDYLNTHGLHILEVAEDQQWRGLHCWDLLGAANADAMKRAVHAANAGETSKFQIDYITPRGTVKSLDIIFSAVNNAGSDLVKPQLICVSRDITDQKKAERELQQTANHFRIATDAAKVGTWLYDLGSSRLDWSNLHKSMWGYDEELDHLTFEDWHRVILPEDRDAALNNVEMARINHTDYLATYRIRRPNDQQIRWMSSFGQYVYDQNNEAISLTGITLDITEQRLTQEAIIKSEERFRTLAESLPQLVWMTDTEGKSEYSSHQWKEYSGLDPDDPDTWQQLVHPDDMEHMMLSWQNSRLAGMRYHAEARLRNKSGEYRWHFVQGEPILNQEGSIVNWIGSFTDIHDQKTLSQKLEKLVSERTLELQRSNEDLQQFAHVASHDLKEPVRKVRTFTSRLKEEYGMDLPERARMYVSKMENAADRMYAMIDGVLLYSSLNAVGQSMELINLNDLIATIESDLELVISQKNAVIEYRELPMISGYSILMYQLFYNLLNNSLKFSRSGIDPVITIHSETRKPFETHAQNVIEITVRDNGIGFHQSEADKIFKTFSRLNSKDRFEGTGLGLALCKKIVERHNGEIYATGKEGEGCTFTIRLPVDY